MIREKIKKYFFSLSDDLSNMNNWADEGFFIISAYRPVCSEQENINNHRCLCKIIRSQKLRFIEMVGHLENNNTNFTERNTEKFLFVPFDAISYQKDILALASVLMTRFSQDIIIFHDPGSVVLLYNQGCISEITEFNFNKITEMFFTNKFINSDRTFVMDGRLIPNGFLGALFLAGKGHIF